MQFCKTKYVGIVILMAAALLICVGCGTDNATMPYGSPDYENGEWTLEELVNHLEELGFDEIDIEERSSRYASKDTLTVEVEDTESDSWFTEYKGFEKGEPVNPWRDVRIIVTRPTPVMTIENFPELVNILPLRDGTGAEFESWKSFMKEHNGELIEFDGVVTYWYDEFWYASGISFEISFENTDDIAFYWNVSSTNELGFKNDYYTGCVQEGSPAHVILEIVCTEERCTYELDSIQFGS